MTIKNPSLLKKSAARMVAVQLIYQAAMLGEALTPDAAVKRMKAQLKDNTGEQKLLTGSATEPDYPLLSKLLAGVIEWGGEIEKRLGETLNTKWKKERMSKLLVAILECAIFEMFFFKEVKRGVIIDEYTRLARHFFEEDEVNFVYAALTSLAKKYGDE